MQLIKDEKIEKLLERFNRCVIIYRLFSDDSPYEGLPSHRKAVEASMRMEAEEIEEDRRETALRRGQAEADAIVPLKYDISIAKAERIDPVQFLSVPDVLRTDRNGNVFYDTGINPESDDFEGTIPYWYAFLEPPHGSGCKPDDLRELNASLFPHGPEPLEIYEWSTDWSDLFDDGHEWWGAACWSIYDTKEERYTVMFASATD